MRIPGTVPIENTGNRKEIIYRFATVSSLAGLLLGIFEAAMLRSSPRVPFLLVPDIGQVEWFLAPLVDMACFGLWGVLLGWLAARKPGKQRTAMCVAADAAAVVMFVALRIRWLHTRVVMKDFAFAKDVLVPLGWYAAGFAASLLVVYLLWTSFSLLAGRFQFRGVRFLSYGLVLAGALAIGGILFFQASPFPNSAASGEETDAGSGSPNIVFIVMDTVRADHLSSYGYSRPTTPNLDRLACQGVLFENAIAPTSWTLASHASMFTGLLPHQHGTDWWIPLPPGPRTMAQVLRSHGYQTAGFVANFDYCQNGWGIGRGFETYIDDSNSLRRNLAGTLVGTALIQPVYQTFCRFDYLQRQDAHAINQEVFRWFRQQPRSPFFLFINYFDAHVPYLTQPPYAHRFGTVSNRLAHKLFDALQGPDLPKGLTPADRTALIAGYDNCLAYLDAQIGRLLDFLRNSPEGKNTIVIITSDHGEEFGEQGFYSHGYNLYHEVLHVPLIIAGPGIPQDMRIRHLVRTRDLFSTVLDLAAGGKNPFTRDSLARFWNPGFKPGPFDNFVVSELVPIFSEGGKQATISLTTPEWQYILNSDGRQELFRWPTDPLDQTNLADSPSGQAAIDTLQQGLVQEVADSSEPWRGPNYLFAHSRKGGAFFDRVIAARRAPRISHAEKHRAIGAAQAFLGSEEERIPPRPATPDRDQLKSLPYH